MTVAILGGGGREHALAWACRRGSPASRILAAPGNPGSAAEGAELRDWPVMDGNHVAEVALAAGVSYVIVGPEGPLVAGVADRLRAAGIATFGPSAAAAAIEGSKAWAKEFMVRHAIATARFSTCDSPAAALAAVDRFGLPVVVKADGLAAGKGVFVCGTRAEAAAALDALLVERTLGAAGEGVVIEECLRGPECTVLAVTDGESWRLLPAARDHKRLRDGDRGPNTGGMGVVAPLPELCPSDIAAIERAVIAPTIRGLAAEGRRFVGVLYAGLMWTADGPRVIEYNCRFGDPEAQAVLPLLDGDVSGLFEAAARGELGRAEITVRDAHAHTVVLAAEGYPAAPQVGAAIHGLAAGEGAGTGDALVFQAGTRVAADGGVVVAGGRVLAVTGLGPTPAAARDAARRRIATLTFAGMQFRRDIGQPVTLPAPTH